MMVLKLLGILLCVLCVLIGIPLALLLLAGALKLSVRAGYCEDMLLVVGIGPFRLNLTKMAGEEAPPPNKQGNRRGKKKKPAKTQAKQEKKKEKKQKPPKLVEKPSLTETVTAFKDLAAGILSRFARHLKIEELRLRVLVASDDAAKTAMEYGAVCTAAGAVQAIADSARRVNRNNVLVQVECDFLAETPELDAELCVSVRLWRLYLIALFAAKPLIEAVQLLKAYRYARGESETKGSQTNGNTHETTD